MYNQVMSNRETRVFAAEIFIKAARYIRDYGWQIKGMGSHGKPRCSMGALASAYQKRIWDKKLSAVMYEELYKKLDGITLTQFNYKYKSGNKVAELYEQVAMSLTQ